MSFTAWDRARGDRQLRVVQPSGFAQTDAAAFVLGSDDEDVFEELVLGDFVEAFRSVDLTGINFVRGRFLLRGPNVAPPVGFFWLASIAIDFIDEATAIVPVGRGRSVSDLAAHVSKLSGTHTVGYKLELCM